MKISYNYIYFENIVKFFYFLKGVIITMKVKSIILTVFLMLILCFSVSAAEEQHTHCVCGGDIPAGHTCSDIQWKEWNLENITEAGNYYLTKSSGALDRNIFISKDAHICLNGCSIGFLTNRNIEIQSGVSVTFCDCSSDNTGGVGGAQNLSTISVYGNLDVYQGKYTSTDCAIYNYSTGTVNFYNGRINANGSSYPNGINNSKGTLNIYDGIFHGYNKDINKYSGTVSIMGGIFTKEVPSDLIADGYECVANPDDRFYCYKVQKLNEITILSCDDQIKIYNPDSVSYDDVSLVVVCYQNDLDFVVGVQPKVDILSNGTTYVPLPQGINTDSAVKVKVFVWYDLENIKPVSKSACFE